MTSLEIPNEMVAKWQVIVDIMARIVDAPVGLLMRVVESDLKVLVASNSDINPYQPGSTEDLQELAHCCDQAFKEKGDFFAPNATRGARAEMRLRDGLNSYLGLPIRWPDRKPFGIICVLDRQENSYSEIHRLLITQFRNIIESHLELVHLQAQHEEDEAKLNLFTLRLLLAARANGFGVWDFDLKTRRLVWDDRMLKIHNLKKDGFAGRLENWIELLHPEDAEWVMADVRQVMDGKVPGDENKSGPFRIITPTGKLKWTVSSYLVIRDAQGQPLRAVGTTHDVTESCQLMQKLEKSCADLKTAENLAKMGSWSLDLADNKITWSEGLYNLFGRDTLWPIPGLEQHRTMFTKESFSRIMTSLDECKMKGVSYSIELDSIRSDGTHFAMLAHGEALRDSDGQIVRLFGTAQDITDRKKLQQQLIDQNAFLEMETARAQRATQFKSEYLANMSHELRTPLTGIIGLSELLCDPKLGTLNATQSDFLQDLRKSGDHLLELINTLLDLSKIESGQMDLTLKSFSLGETIREVADILVPMAGKKNIYLFTVIELTDDVVSLDLIKFKQILYNLLSNALKFSHQDGRVELHVGALENDRIEITVKDSGIGIKPGDMDRLFRRFQQLASNSEHCVHGTGLGLALSKELVELHGGTIEATSVFGKGTQFTVVLPRKSPPISA
jgi:PAS domain S-box-containing protein